MIGAGSGRIEAFLIASGDGLLLVRPGATEPTPTSFTAWRTPSSAAASSGSVPPRSWLGRRRPAVARPSVPTGTHPAVATVPAVLAILDGSVHAWDPQLGTTVELTDDELDALATVLDAVPEPAAIDPAVVERLRSLDLITTPVGGDRGADTEGEASTDEATGVTGAAPVLARPLPTVNDRRPAVHAVFHSGNDDPCLALGMVIAHARAYRDGALASTYRILRPHADATGLLAELAIDPSPRILLLSDYLWSISENLELSTELKRRSPGSLTIHGGPSAPKYAEDCEQFLREHPAVDIVVRGEGEITLAETLETLAGRWDPRDLGVLEGVAGLSFRRHLDDDAFEVVRTPDRERLVDLAPLPSPYLTGEFDDLGADQTLATVETNRGCPYGCTFCDWGSATNSRIRQFPTERVRHELRWIAERGIQSVFFADANFGIFERDVDFAREVVDLYERYGAPTTVIASFAKNTIKHTAEIVRILNEGGVRTDAAAALQTVDESTLTIIRRKNLPQPAHDQLVAQFRELDLPLLTDIMIGLPGATVASFKRDLDYCADRNMTIRFCETFILPNSPMNDPDYRRTHAIVTSDDGRLIETSSYSRLDYLEMLSLRKLFRTLDHFGLLRHVLRHVAWDHGIALSDQLVAIARIVRQAPARYPLLSLVIGVFDLHAAEPVGWAAFYEEVAAFYERELGIARDEAMSTVLAAQQALMPSRHQRYPLHVQLDHDLVAYEDDRWEELDASRPLASYGPTVLTIHDPRNLRELAARTFDLSPNADGIPRREENSGNPGFYDHVDWELESPLKRTLYSQVGRDRATT